MLFNVETETWEVTELVSYLVGVIIRKKKKWQQTERTGRKKELFVQLFSIRGFSLSLCKSHVCYVVCSDIVVPYEPLETKWFFSFNAIH